MYQIAQAVDRSQAAQTVVWAFPEVLPFCQPGWQFRIVQFAVGQNSSNAVFCTRSTLPLRCGERGRIGPALLLHDCNLS